MAATDQDKLRMLLPHWIEHNAEHADEFRSWAQKARVAGEAEAADEIDDAAEKLARVNESLNAALAKLSRPA